MKKLKTILLAGVLTAGIFSTAVFTSCNSDACADVVCSNGGSCVDGTCVCPVGYEGTTCTTESRAKFAKSWSCNDQKNGTTTPILYTSIIAAGSASNVTTVLISNFSDIFVNSVSATVNGNTITIASQAPDNDGYYVTGTGTLTNNKINWSYSIKNPSNVTDSYTGVWQ
jgi:hypothetical protein